MTVIDYHTHWWPPEALEYLEKASKPARNLPALPLITADPVMRLELRTELMDKAGIDVAVLSNQTQPDARLHPELARVSNEALATVVSDRFRFFASLPLPLVEESIAEFERVIGLEGCEGVIMPTHVQGEPLDGDQFEPLLAALDARSAIVALHPDAFRAPGVLKEWFMDWTVGAPFEDTIVALRLCSSGRIDQFPDIRWIVPHAGGTLPYLWHRMDAQYRAGLPLGFERTPSDYARRFFYDTAATSSESLALAVAEQGADRLVFGTDYPFVDRQIMGGGGSTVLACPALDAAAAQSVLAGSALATGDERT